MELHAKDEIRKSGFSGLDALAVRINDSHRMCETAVQAGVAHAMNCGDALMLARANVGHGQWLAWLAANCPGLSPRMSQRYIRIAKNREFLSSNATSTTHLTISGALELLAEPKPKSLVHDCPHGPLPDPGHDLFGRLPDGRWIHLTAAENPAFCFYAILDADLKAMSFGAKCVRREAVHPIVLYVEAGVVAGGDLERHIMIIDSGAGAGGTGDYDPETVDWHEQRPCQGWPGIYYEGYVPPWKLPGWAEARKAMFEKAEADGTLETLLIAEDIIETGTAGLHVKNPLATDGDCGSGQNGPLDGG